MSELRKDPIIGRWVIIATKRAKRPNDFLAKELESDSCNKNHNSLAMKNNFNLAEGSGFHQIIDDGCCAKSNADCDFYHIFSSYKQKILEIKKNNQQIKYIVIFRNYKLKTNSKNLRHNNSNLIGLPVYPKNTKREIEGALKYYQEKKSCIYCDIISQEKESGQRFIFENDSFIVISPFASRFPLETWILPKKHCSDYSQINQDQLRDLSAAFKKILLKMKSLLGDFPYTYTLHTSPIDGDKDDNISLGYHWYLEIIPLLTRVAGFEWGTGFYINPTPPESAAKYLSQADIKIKTE
ncbi:MAG: hypothetical protein K9L61_01555 [Candidatus Omnitrophica bacterium]|nr:hypothetical protein [Candidatus Omnitrophota bacterium]